MSFLLTVTVSVVLLSTKIGFRRCHWLLLVVLLMMRTTKVLMKALLLIFVVAKTRQNTTGLMKKVCLVLVMSYGYGGVGVLNENIGALSLRFIRYTFGIGHMKHQKGRVFALDFYGLWQSQGKAPLVLHQKGRVFALDFYGLWQSQGKAPLVL
eukprot:1169264_1